MEKDAVDERDECDYNTKITMEMANSNLGMNYNVNNSRNYTYLIITI